MRSDTNIYFLNGYRSKESMKQNLLSIFSSYNLDMLYDNITDIILQIFIIG